MNKLSPKQATYVEEFLKSGNATQSAIAAGYSEKNAYKASRRLEKNENVRAALEEARKSSSTMAKYTYEVAMKQCDVGIELAVTTKNANAYAKLVELKSKLSGILTERLEVSGLPNLIINISGLDDLPGEKTFKAEISTPDQREQQLREEQKIASLESKTKGK